MKLILAAFTMIFTFVTNAEALEKKTLYCPTSWGSCCGSESFSFDDGNLVEVSLVGQNQRGGWLVNPKDVVKVEIKKEDQINVEFAVNHSGAYKPYQTKVSINLNYDSTHQPTHGARNEYLGNISVQDDQGNIVTSRTARCNLSE